MPVAALRICPYPGCGEKVKNGYCQPHKKKQSKQRESKRKSSHQRGYTYRWSKASKAYLKDNPLCVHCKAQGILTKATEVDHITPHQMDMDLFWDINNLQSLCKSCHSRKTINEYRADH